jgi:hypothetical protein
MASLWDGAHHRCVYASRAGSARPAAMMLRARWLRSPPHMRGKPCEPDRSRDRGWDCRLVSQARGETVPSETER